MDRLVDHCHSLVSAFPFQPRSACIGPSDFQGHGQGFADLSVVWGLPCAVNWHRLKLVWSRFLLPLYVPRASSLQIVLAPEVPLLTLQTQPFYLPQLHFGAFLDRFCPWLPVPPCSRDPPTQCGPHAPHSHQAHRGSAGRTGKDTVESIQCPLPGQRRGCAQGLEVGTGSDTPALRSSLPTSPGQSGKVGVHFG